MANLNIDITSITTGGGIGTPAGTYEDPYLVGSSRLFSDSSSEVLRTKYDADPSSETDGDEVLAGTSGLGM